MRSIILKRTVDRCPSFDNFSVSFTQRMCKENGKEQEKIKDLLHHPCLLERSSLRSPLRFALLCCVVITHPAVTVRVPLIPSIIYKVTWSILLLQKMKKYCTDP
jgi:hypothetical protein